MWVPRMTLHLRDARRGSDATLELTLRAEPSAMAPTAVAYVFVKDGRGAAVAVVLDRAALQQIVTDGQQFLHPPAQEGDEHERCVA